MKNIESSISEIIKNNITISGKKKELTKFIESQFTFLEGSGVLVKNKEKVLHKDIFKNKDLSITARLLDIIYHDDNNLEAKYVIYWSDNHLPKSLKKEDVNFIMKNHDKIFDIKNIRYGIGDKYIVFSNNKLNMWKKS